MSKPSQRETHLAPGWKPRTEAQIHANAARWGYTGWALYWGLPACFGLIRVIGRKLLEFWVAALIGFPVILVALAVIVIAGGFYAVYGGGILHFFRRWWFLCHPRTSPTTVPSSAPPPTPHTVAPSVLPPPSSPPSSFQSRIQRLDELLQQGLISRDEYDRRRKEIIDEATR